MSILSNYYELLTFITIANGEVKEIDPDKPYTIVYNSGRMLSQSTGLIRGVIGETNVIVTIPLDADDSNYATIINTRTIISIDPYSFDAHFEDFNNWIGVEVSEHNCIQMRVKFVNSESIVMVEEGKKYEVGYVHASNGNKTYITATGVVKTIIRNTTKEAMPAHINHFTNDIDYIIVFDFASEHDSYVASVNVIDIRVIRPYISPISYDIALLNELQTQIDICRSYNIDRRDYTYLSYNAYKDALFEALDLLNMDQSVITNDKLRTALNNLRTTLDELKDIDDEYDLIVYDADAKTISCRESIYPILMRSISDSCVAILYYTNFGTPKWLHINSNEFDKFNVSWSDVVPLPEDKPKPDESLLRRVQDHFIKASNIKIDQNTEQLANLYIEGCTFENLDLGIAVKLVESMGSQVIISDGFGSKLPLKSPDVRINNANIHSIYASGCYSNRIGIYGNLSICSSKINGIMLGSYNMSLYEGEDNNDRLEYRSRYMDVLLSDVTCDKVWCGGVDSNSDNINLIIGGGTIGELYLSGLHGSITSNVFVSVLTDSTVNGVYVCENHNKVKDVHIVTAGNHDIIVPGAYKTYVDSEVLDSDNSDNGISVNIQLKYSASVVSINKGYSLGELLEPEGGKLCIEYPTVITDEYKGIYDCIPLEELLPENPDNKGPEETDTLEEPGLDKPTTLED